MKTGIELIAEEVKQVSLMNKWNYENDEDYGHGELAAAAACYAANSILKDRKDKQFVRFQVKEKITEEYGFPVYSETDYVDGWPWADEYDNRSKHNSLKSLIVAGALIAAEIDRLQNQSKQ